MLLESLLRFEHTVNRRFYSYDSHCSIELGRLACNKRWGQSSKTENQQAKFWNRQSFWNEDMTLIRKNISTFFARRRVMDRFAVVLAMSALAASPLVSLETTPAEASLSVSYDFNTDGIVTSDFNLTGSGVSQTSTGGISNTGAILAPGSANAVYASKSSYSLGPVGSTYVFETFLESIGNSGYSGVGFTASSPAVATGGSVYRPSDAIGISVHGGGYVFHNGATDIFGNWDSDTAGITTVKKSSIGDLLNNGSPQKWYKVVFKIVRDSLTTFDTRVEIWPSDSAGVLLRPTEADAIFEWNDISNNSIVSAPAIYSYFNFSGYRVRHFDNFSVNLSGGATVVQSGAPVVLTSSTATVEDVVSVTGKVAADGGAALAEQGFVFGATDSPVVETDTKVTVTPVVGEFTAAAPTLPTGQYFVRAFAKNAANLVSYGVALPIQITSSEPAPSAPPQNQDPAPPPAQNQGEVVAPEVKPPPESEPDEIAPKKPKKPKATPTAVPRFVSPPEPTPTPKPLVIGEGGSTLMPILEPTEGSSTAKPKSRRALIRDVLSAPIAYVLSNESQLPKLPKLGPSDSIAVENGISSAVKLVITDELNGYSLSSAGWEVRLDVSDQMSAPVPLDEFGNVVLNEDRLVQVSGTGFQPNSPVRVWLFSEPVRLADITTDENGNFVGQAQLPEGIPTGEHTVQLNGLTKDGQLRSVSLGVVVQPNLVVTPAAPVGFDLTGLMNFLWVIAAGVLTWFFIVWRRRKKKEEEGEIPNTSGVEGLPIFASEGFEPSQQFPNDSRRKIGAAAPPTRKRFTFKPKGA
jgi:hypothetical protein